MTKEELDKINKYLSLTMFGLSIVAAFVRYKREHV